MRRQFSKFAQVAGIMLALVFTFSCSDDKDEGGGSGGGGSTFKDDRDGKSYKYVKIGEQTWMAENLNCDVAGSKCYNNSEANCDIYGRLYDWAVAMNLPGCSSQSCASYVDAKHRGICPSGWHIPSNADWDKLVRYVDGTNGTSSLYDSPTAGRYLKTSDWNGEDKYGFRLCLAATAIPMAVSTMSATTATGGALARAVPTAPMAGIWTTTAGK